MVRSEQVSLSSTCRQTSGHWGTGALGHWGIGALGHWGIGGIGGIGALGHWGIGALGHLSVVSGQRSVVGSKGSTHGAPCRSLPRRWKAAALHPGRRAHVAAASARARRPPN